MIETNPRRSSALLFSCLAILFFAPACSEEAPPPEPTASAPTKPERRKPALITEPPKVVPLLPGLPRTPFIEGFESSMSRDEVLAVLGEDSVWSEGRGSSLEARGHCPGAEFTSINVQGWADLGAEGQLKLNFTNGELASLGFKPTDYMDYRTRSQKMRGIKIRTNSRHRVAPATSVWASPLRPVSVLYEDLRATRRDTSVRRACKYQSQQEDAAASQAQPTASGDS